MVLTSTPAFRGVIIFAACLPLPVWPVKVVALLIDSLCLGKLWGKCQATMLLLIMVARMASARGVT